MKEDFISFETAKLLKEKGFNWEVHRSYLVNDNCFAPADVNDIPNRKDAIRIPTLQMAMKYLREVHKLEIYPYHQNSEKGDKWWFEIVKFPSPVSDYESNAIYATYEEACEDAIKYCLENLI